MTFLQVAIITLAMLLVITVSMAVADSNPSETEAVRDCFEGFKKAIDSSNGEQALNFVYADSIQHYGAILDVALHGDAKALEPLPLADKFLVLSVRHRVPVEKAAELTPKSLYVLTVGKRWLGTATTRDRSIDTVTAVSVEKAQASQLVRGGKTNETIAFHKENGVWKIGLDYQSAIMNAMLTKALKESRLPEKDFFAQILGVATHKRVLPTLWEPMIAKPAEQSAKQ